MNRWKREKALRTVSVLFVGLLLVGLSGGMVAAQAINVEGDFTGTLNGYDDSGTDRPHMVSVEGDFTITGENAQNVQITVEPGQQMVLDQGSVEAFVAGDRDVSFDQSNRESRVLLTTDEIPSGTTIQVNFETVFVGGATTNELNGGTVTVSYETPGGTEGEESFDAQTDMSASADNRIDSLQSEISGMEDWRLIGIAGGAFGAFGIIGMILLYLRCCREDNPPTPTGPTGPN